MKILQLCHKPPLPPKDGGCIAMNNITQGLLQQNHQVKVVAISTPKHPVNSKDLDADYYKKTKFETVFINTGTNLFKIFKTMLFNRSYYISRFYSKELEKNWLRFFKETFDIVQLESIFVTPYIPIIKRHSKAKIILRTHNIEHKIWQRRTAQQSSIFKKLIFTSLTKKLKRSNYPRLTISMVICRFLRTILNIFTVNSLIYRRPPFLSALIYKIINLKIISHRIIPRFFISAASIGNPILKVFSGF